MLWACPLGLAILLLSNRSVLVNPSAAEEAMFHHAPAKQIKQDKEYR